MTTPDFQGQPPYGEQNQSSLGSDAISGQQPEQSLNPEPLLLEGKPPGEQEQAKSIQAAAEHWRRVANEAPVQAIPHVEEAAKQLITLTSLLQGLYFAVFAFSDIRKQAAELSPPILGGLILLVFFFPVALWLISLYCATQVFVPKVRPGVNLNDISPGAWQQLKQKYEETVAEKLKWLHRSHRWLLISFAAVLIILIMLAFLPAPAQPTPTPIIIVTPTPTHSLP